MKAGRCEGEVERILLFPGQSSRDPHMLERLIAAWAPAARLVAEASATLGRDLRALYHPGRGAAVFADHRSVQVGVFLCTHLHLEALRAHGLETELSLGLSLGEYNHLVHIGALSFAEALRLVDARGAAFDHGPRGQTVAVYPLEHEGLAEFVRRAREHGVVDVVIFNSPTQHVVAGERAAVQALLQMLGDETVAEAVVLDDRLPLHSELLAPVAGAFRSSLRLAAWRRPHGPYHPNVQPGPLPAATPQTFIDLLTRQVATPVYWRQSLDEVADRHPGAELIEVGPRAVLFNLLRRWRPNPRRKTDFPDGLVVAGPPAEVSCVA